ncbi:cytochrome b/b6 domain-containing protein [Comamonas sp. Y33R10-2]|uniref:cytochrome b/b6 domain-containing protein n=1 Tax=Comamonas sp. Y33R10-2 TaxID=2853257 RepID=UPI001C5C9D42|nr:cytochrome b/b6 domain-containing protein [Comamonas sp. Y33R10-2]QXZ08920.1 cytochrome b/b6 domain-containing protein [Comamonas sp. Y33R10-2]
MTQAATPAPATRFKVRIWDLPTRLFHWLLAVCIVALVVTAKLGGNAMNWHLILGQVVLALLIFRLLWGLVGGYWSRFGSFIPSPVALKRYVRGESTTQDRAGHNPLGALSVIAMLMVLIAQIASGLMSDDEIAFSGPLTRFVSGELISQATNYHAHWGQYLIYGLIALHLLAVIGYSFKGHKLVPAMVTGDKLLNEPATPAHDSAGTRLLAAVLAVIASGASWWIYQLGHSAAF